MTGLIVGARISVLTTDSCLRELDLKGLFPSVIKN